MGQALEPSAAADLVLRAAGLAAPEAPTQGDLVPNASGWLIGAGGRTRQLYPDLLPWMDRLFAASMALVWVSWFPHTLLGRLPLLAIATVVFHGRGLIPRLRLRRQLGRAQRATRLGNVPAGTLVRVVGTIAPQATVPTLFRGVPAVLARNRIADADETRGLDFLLDLDQGEQIKVAVRRAFLLEPPERSREPPACGPVSAYTVGRRQLLRSELFEHQGVPSWRGRRYESSVGPGDRVEVCGVVRHVPAPDLEGRFLRVPPMRTVLVGEEERPLLVRRG